MAFVPEQEFPDLSQLIASLNNSQISVSNPALYQTIKRLIEKVQTIKGLTTEDIENINQQLTDLSNTINNFIIGAIIETPRLWMPTFDGEKGEDGFPIPGRDGRDGLDGKSIPNFDSDDDCCDPLVPFGPFCPVCGASSTTSEFSTTSTGNVDDLAFSNANLIRFNNATDATLRGIAAGTAGQVVRIVSVGAGNVYLAHQNAGSSANNRLINFVTSGNTPLVAGKGIADFQYDGTTARWRLIAHDQGDWLTPTFAAGDYTCSGAMTITVTAPEVLTNRYKVVGNILFHKLLLSGSTLGGVADTQIIYPTPNGYVFTVTAVSASGRIQTTGPWSVALIISIAAATQWLFSADVNGTAYGLGNLNFQVESSFEID